MRIKQTSKDIVGKSSATFFRGVVGLAIALCAVVLHPIYASAEIIRPKSTFQRIYSEDQAGTTNFARI